LCGCTGEGRFVMSYTFRQSEIKRFIRCRRSWWLQYQEGWKKPDDYPGAHHTGTLYHEGVGAYRVGEDRDGAAQAVHDAFNLEVKPEDVGPDHDAFPDWIKSLSLALRMVEGYIDWSEEEGIEAGRKSIVVEEQREQLLPFQVSEHDITITYKADHVYEDTMLGGYVLDDLKSVATLSQTPPTTDFQLLTYSYLEGLRLGKFPVRAQHSMGRRVLRTAAAKPPFYGESGFGISERMMGKHADHLYAIIADMIRVIENVGNYGLDTPSLYPNPNKDCSWDCGMLDVCGMVDDGSDYETVLGLNYVKRETDE